MSDSTPATSGPPVTLGQLFASILRRMLIVTIAITVIGAGVGWLVADSRGLWGALIGGGIGLLFCGTTVVSMVVSEGKSPQFLAIVVLGSWLVKMVFIVIALAVLRHMTFYDRYVLAATLGAIVIASLTIEMLAIKSARIPLVDVPPSSVSPTDAPPTE